TCGKTFRHNRVAVHDGFVMGRRVDIADHILGKHTTQRVAKRDGPAEGPICAADLRGNQVLGFFYAKHIHSAKNARNMSWPCSVRKLSGWNCTPTTGSVLWRMAMISLPPSGASAQAETRKS